MKKKIKILFRHRSMEMGGVEKVLLSMLNHLDRNKFDISLCLSLFQGELRNHIPDFIPYKTLAGGKEDFPKNIILNKIFLICRAIKLAVYRKFPWVVDRFILKNDADIEIATGYTMFANVLNSSNKKSKKIGWFHSDITYQGFAPILNDLLTLIPKFDFFIFGSQQAQDIFIKTYPDIKLRQHQVIVNTIPIDKIKRQAIEYTVKKDNIPTFISVGRLHNRKGYHILANVHKKLLEKGFKHNIKIIGDGEEMENLKKQISLLNIEDTFQLLGTLMNPYPYILNSDFYIMSSRSEGWPLIIAETLILKKPIISTNVGGVSEMIKHKYNGYLVDCNEDSIFEGMKEFLTNQELINRISKNIENIEKQFDNQKIYNSVELILEKIIKK